MKKYVIQKRSRSCKCRTKLFHVLFVLFHAIPILPRPHRQETTFFCLSWDEWWLFAIPLFACSQLLIRASQKKRNFSADNRSNMPKNYYTYSNKATREGYKKEKIRDKNLSLSNLESLKSLERKLHSDNFGVNKKPRWWHNQKLARSWWGKLEVNLLLSVLFPVSKEKPWNDPFSSSLDLGKLDQTGIKSFFTRFDW